MVHRSRNTPCVRFAHHAFHSPRYRGRYLLTACLVLLPRKNFILIVLFTWSLIANCHASDDWEAHPEWSGAWNTGTDVAKLLGFEAREDVSTFPSTLQIEFCVSKDAAFQVLGKQSAEFVQSITEKMGHEIVAAGWWKKHTNGDANSMCFATEKRGCTYH